MKIPNNHFPILGHQSKTYRAIDLSVQGEIALQQKENWYEYLANLPSDFPTIIHHGGYLEHRFFYSNEALFGSGPDRRAFHLGLDLWIPAGTDIYTPFAASVQSVKYNPAALDYGNTIILRHEIEDFVFYSLYGHLSASHVGKLKANDLLKKGEKFCTIGAHAENGGWPPHLHLQLMLDLQDHEGDYPGVSSAAKLDYYKRNCPDPTPLIF